MPRFARPLLWSFLLFPAFTGTSNAQYGIILTGGGPVNRAMGGVATATPVDPIGTLFWNPAGISAFDQSRLAFGVDALIPSARLSSTVPANAIGPGIPATTVSGAERSESGTIPVPNIGWVHRLDDSPYTFGLGVLTMGGFGLNYPGSFTDPLLTARPPNGLGLGPAYSQYVVLQIVPTVAVQLTDRLSFGFAPILDMGNLMASPAVVASPDDANRNGFATYPAAVGTRYHFGGGFQTGLYWQGDKWNLGASFKSPQWFETYRFHSADELGRPQTLTFAFDVPMIVSFGAAFTGFERLVLGVDLRYIGYSHTRGYADTGFDATGAIRGLGWRDVYVVALGSQYQLTDRIAVQLGYSYHTNPIRDDQTFYSIAAPLHVEHIISTGISYSMTQNVKLSLAYVHVFEHSNTGPIYTPSGIIPGSSVTSTASCDSVIFGVNVAY